eukprot:26132_4
MALRTALGHLSVPTQEIHALYMHFKECGLRQSSKHDATCIEIRGHTLYIIIIKKVHQSMCSCACLAPELKPS